jgi:hypothetical protein
MPPPPPPPVELVVVDPEAIRPVAKVQASEAHSRALDACLEVRGGSTGAAEAQAGANGLALCGAHAGGGANGEGEGGEGGEGGGERGEATQGADVASLRSRVESLEVSSSNADSPSVSSSSSSVPTATKRQLAAPLDAFILSGVLTAGECARLIACADAASYSFWNAATSTSTFRNSDTVEITSTKVASELWERVKHLVVPRVTITPGGDGDKLWEPGLEGEWEACGGGLYKLNTVSTSVYKCLYVSTS